MRDTAPPKRLAARPRPRRGWVWALIAVVAVSAIVVAASPYALQYGLQRWLHAQGAQQVQIEALRANPFSGEIRITGLQIVDADGANLRATELHTRFLWRGLLDRQVAFETLSVREAEAPLTGITGSLLAPRDNAWPWVVQRLQVADVSLYVPAQDEPLRVQITEAEAGPWSSRADQALTFSVRGRLADAPLRLQGQTTPTEQGLPHASARLELDGLALATVAPDGFSEGALSLHLKLRSNGSDDVPRLHYEGTVRVESLRAALAGDRRDRETGLHSARLLWAGDGVLEYVEDRWLLRQQGRLTLKTPKLQRADSAWSADGLEWHGRMQAVEGANITTEGTLEARGLRVQTDDGPSLSARRLQWKGTLGRGTLDVPGGFSAQGELQFDELALTRAVEPALLLHAQRAALHRLDVKGTYRATAQTLQLSSFRTLAPGNGDGPGLMHGERALLSDLALSHGRRLEAEQLRLHDIQLRLQRHLDGTWSGVPALIGTAQPSDPKPTSWRIARVEVQGEDSTLRLEHYGLRPPLLRTLKLAELTLGELDSARPQQLTPLSLHGTDDHGARVVAVGKLMPFSETLNLALKTKITGIGMPSLGPYAARHLGYRTEAGVATLDSDLHVVDDQLRSNNVLRIRGLQLSPARAATDQPFQRNLGMPLPVAVALLQPETSRLRLSVPVRADLRQSQSPLGEIIERALGESLRAAALRVAEQVLHPYGPAGGDAVGLRLEPLRFRSGSTQLTTVTRAYLGRIAALLRQRPGLRLRICGVSVEIEAAARSPALAQRRTDTVLHSLRDQYHIDPQRLSPCAPPPSGQASTGASADRGLPRAELRLQ